MKKSVFTAEYAVLRAELVKMRTQAGLTQRALAHKLGVSHSWVAKVEMGERRLDVIELLRVLCACKAEPLPVVEDLLKKMASPKRRNGKE